MRRLALATLVVLAACSEEKSGGGKAPATALKMQPGQWETTVELTSMTMADKSMPGVKTGTKTTTSSCVTAAQVEKPEAAIFAGSPGTCKYDNFYMSNGRINASMNCKQSGMNGNVMSNVDGKYTATTFDAVIDTATYTGAGDFKMNAKVSGRRVSDICTPEAEPKAG